MIKVKEYMLEKLVDKLKDIVFAEDVYLWQFDEGKDKIKYVISSGKSGCDIEIPDLDELDKHTEQIVTGGTNNPVISFFQKELSIMIHNIYIIKICDGPKTWGYLKIVNFSDEGIIEIRAKEVRYIRTLIENSIAYHEQIKYAKEKLLTLSNVKKTYYVGNVITPVLKGITIDIFKGELITILGASGSGKTTLLNLIGGMDSLTEGKFIFEGKDYSTASERVLTNYRRNNVGYIFQAYNLMPNLRVKENIDFIAALCKHPYDSREILRSVGMVEYDKNYPSQLSGGQQQRVSIARAIVKKPQIILADEPTAALDYKNSIEILKILQKLVLEGATMVMVTHNEEISKMANRIVRIHDGMIVDITQNRQPCLAESIEW